MGETKRQILAVGLTRAVGNRFDVSLFCLSINSKEFQDTQKGRVLKGYNRKKQFAKKQQ